MADAPGEDAQVQGSAGTDPEAALLVAIARGDGDAFRRLLEVHLDTIHAYLYRMTGSRTDAEDLAQETFLRVWRKASTFEPGRVKVTTWLHSIAHNLCLDLFRRNRFTDVDNGEITTVDETADPERQVSSRELGRLLERAIGALPEAQRAALLLCQVQGFSNAEAARILSVNVRALESLLARARRTLRERLRTADATRGP